MTKPATKPTLFSKGKRTSFLKTKRQQMTAAETAKLMAEHRQLKKQLAMLQAEKAGAR